MDWPRLLVRSGALAAVALLVALTVFTMQSIPSSATARAIVDASGQPLAVPDAPTVEEGTWYYNPVLVFVAPAKELAGVEAARGPGSATPSTAVPGHPDLRLFALSAKSTYLGCSVTFNPTLGSSRDVANYAGGVLPGGRLMDRCHFGMWDPFHRGAPLPPGPAPIRLASLDVRVQDGQVVATQFDGRVAPVGHG